MGVRDGPSERRHPVRESDDVLSESPLVQLCGHNLSHRLFHGFGSQLRLLLHLLLFLAVGAEFPDGAAEPDQSTY